jgi:hypothetical protein
MITGKISNLTKDQAVLLFTRSVQEAQQNQVLEFTQAWNQTKLLMPQLAEKAFGTSVPTESAVKPASSATPAPGAPVPYTFPEGFAVRNPFRVSLPNSDYIASLGLPADASYDEWRAADLANADASPRNSFAIFEALIRLFANSMSAESARQKATERFPTLAAEAAASIAK